MASGISSRFGSNKLMTELKGKPLVQYAIDNTAGLFDRVIILTRSAEVRDYAQVRGIECFFHELPTRNLAVRLGMEQLAAEDGVMFYQCDQPYVSRRSLLNMNERFEQRPDGIVILASNGEGGSPVIFSRRFFAELMELPDGRGGAYVIEQHRAEVQLVEALEAYELWDVDTPEDLEMLEQIQ